MNQRDIFDLLLVKDMPLLNSTMDIPFGLVEVFQRI
jgi:hypothetical protein